MIGQLTTPTFTSPIRDALVIKPSKGGKTKKSIVATMMLTSLVDAFTIVVIYLIVNSTSSETLDVADGLSLPKASFSQEIDNSPSVIFKNNQFIINDRSVSEGALQNELKQLVVKNTSYFKSGEPSIIVQADEGVDFDKLQPLLIASSYAGIKHVKFAVLQKD
ncbi:MAG: biopolymer transporter ExbD [Bdellovibrionaceae bacterium]|nr:biopolymer transporter ExbD [Pseudobdellovibrionaceae bacterium]